jgi:hypothetical protein
MEVMELQTRLEEWASFGDLAGMFVRDMVSYWDQEGKEVLDHKCMGRFSSGTLKLGMQGTLVLTHLSPQ